MYTLKKSIRSYVVRGGRLTKSQEDMLNQSENPYLLKNGSNLYQQIEKDSWPCINLEIGFGNGENILAAAQKFPEILFIGIDVYPPGVGQVLHQINLLNLTNIRIFHGDVESALEIIDAQSINCCQILFPDPWHKAKHHKRRLIQTDFMNQLTTKLAHNSILHIACDWPNYVEHIEETIQGNSHLTRITHNDMTKHPKGMLAQRIETKFARRGQKKGHIITDLYYHHKIK